MELKKRTPRRPEPGQSAMLNRNKGTNSHRYIQFSATKSASFASVQDTRQTETAITRALFLANPNTAYSRADLADLLGKPINHATRIAFDLLDENFSEPAGRAINPRSGKSVEVLRLKPRTTTVTQTSLFDRMGGGAL